MSGFTKLDSGIVHSTIWVQPHDVLRVWVAMLALADQGGFVRSAAPALSNLCMIPLDRMREILCILESPDPDSRSAAEDGKRLLKIKGGWWLVNHAEYRRKVSAEEKRAADRLRVAAKRAEGRVVSQGAVTSRDLSQVVEAVAEVAQADADADADKDADAHADNSENKETVGARGSRLPRGWTLPPDWLEWALAERPDLNHALEAEKFRDFWNARVGRNGMRLDWQATWRNWIRGARGGATRGKGKGNAKHGSLAERSYGEGGLL